MTAMQAVQLLEYLEEIKWVFIVLTAFVGVGVVGIWKI